MKTCRVSRLTGSRSWRSEWHTRRSSSNTHQHQQPGAATATRARPLTRPQPSTFRLPPCSLLFTRAQVLLSSTVHLPSSKLCDKNNETNESTNQLINESTNQQKLLYLPPRRRTTSRHAFTADHKNAFIILAVSLSTRGIALTFILSRVASRTTLNEVVLYVLAPYFAGILLLRVLPRLLSW